MSTRSYIPVSEMRRIQQAITDPVAQCEIMADLFRVNTLYMIKQAGSGHIGSSFSCMELITWLWLQEMKNPNEPNLPESDTCFSSKGHDAPGLYSLLIGQEKLAESYLHQLRRLGGLPGHPDVRTPYMATNTGSLGMGISKARGMALANRLSGKKGRFYVLTGDGELQEGQFWESLQPTANQGYSEITVIVDHNKIQSDTWVSQVSDLGQLENKLRAYGWEVARCDGHNLAEIQKILTRFKTVTDRPQILIADTVKGQGVSFMADGMGDNGLYRYHSGAPSDDDYDAAVQELLARVSEKLQSLGIPAPKLESMEPLARVLPQSPQKLVAAYGEELAALGQEVSHLVALDGDLMLDTGLIPFKSAVPERFVECGIAEQDMVSMASGLSLRGMIPVVHSFACFLSTRPNEQIYNNATEHGKIIYAGSLAGLLPAGPGHSHQSLRDISTLGSVPGLTLIQPCDERETKMALRWAVRENIQSTYLRLVSIPVDVPYQLPENYQLIKGRGVSLTPEIQQADAVLFAYGPVMLSEAFLAAQRLLKEQGLRINVINLPWLNFFDAQWLREVIQPNMAVITVDDHYVQFGQGTLLLASISRLFEKPLRCISLGVEDVPVCGQNVEALRHHGLDAESLQKTIAQFLAKVPV